MTMRTAVFAPLYAGLVFCFVAAGCEILTCSESNSSNPYPYAAAYVIGTTPAEPQVEISSPKFQLPPTELKFDIENLIPKDTTGASNDSAANEGVSRPDPAAVQVKKPPFYEIILHTGDNCAPCDVLKHELKLRGIQFKEHRVKSGTVPVAWIDGQEFIGASKIYKRLEIQRTK